MAGKRRSGLANDRRGYGFGRYYTPPTSPTTPTPPPTPPTPIPPTTPPTTTILVYNLYLGESFVWSEVTFTLDTSLPNFSYTATTTYIPATTVPVGGLNLIGVTIGNLVTSIGYQAFSNCTRLSSVTFTPTSTLTSIGTNAFYNCTGLTSVTIPNSVTIIGPTAFYKCTGLTSITIPNSVTSIGNNAFNSSGLTTVTISSATAITLGKTSPTANPPGVNFFGRTVATII